MRYLLAHNGQDCDITVIEGVMGYYDGLGLTSTRASTYETARETESPVVLVVNARGAALSVVAAVQGFLDFAPDNNVQGVILNGCSAMSYGALARELESRWASAPAAICPGCQSVRWRAATWGSSLRTR